MKTTEDQNGASLKRVVRKQMFGTAHWSGQYDGQPALVLSYYGGADLWVWNGGWDVCLHAKSRAELNQQIGLTIFCEGPSELFSNDPAHRAPTNE